MRYLTAADIVYIHDEIIAATSGGFGVREPGLLESIVEKPKAAFGGQELYESVFDKAAAIFEALCNYHVFVDGNKRTSAIAMYRFLAMNGCMLTATNKQLEEYALLIATTNPDLHSVANWIEKHANLLN